MSEQFATVEGQDWILPDGRRFHEIVRMPTVDDAGVSILLIEAEEEFDPIVDRRNAEQKLARPWWRFW